MNDSSKDPQEQDNYSTSSSKKIWLWASVEVHIKNSDNESNPVEVHKRGIFKKGNLK